MVESQIRTNSTFNILPNARHQLVNTGREDLTFIAIIDNLPLRVGCARPDGLTHDTQPQCMHAWLQLACLVLSYVSSFTSAVRPAFRPACLLAAYLLQEL